MDSIDKPFRHWIADGFVPESLVNAAIVEWPSSEWPHWHYYNGRDAVKYATKDVLRLPHSCRLIFDAIASIDVCSITGIHGLFPDTTGYGAGMHWIPNGGHLGVHLDSASHPTAGWERRLSACVYLTDSQSGKLGLYNSDGSELVTAIAPSPGRLVLFECTDISYHGIPGTIEEADGRKSIACFFWSSATGLQNMNRKSASFKE